MLSILRTQIYTSISETLPLASGNSWLADAASVRWLTAPPCSCVSLSAYLAIMRTIAAALGWHWRTHSHPACLPVSWPGQQVRVTSHFSFAIFHTFCFWIMTKAYLPHSSLSILAFMTDSRNSEMKLFKYSYSICKNTLLMIFVINGVFRCYIWYIYYSIYVYMCAFVHFVKKFWKVIFHIFHRIVYYGRKLYFCTYWVFHNILEYYSEWS